MKGGPVVPNSPVNAFSSSGSAIGTNQCVSMQVLLADKTSGGSKRNQIFVDVCSVPVSLQPCFFHNSVVESLFPRL